MKRTAAERAHRHRIHFNLSRWNHALTVLAGVLGPGSIWLARNPPPMLGDHGGDVAWVTGAIALGAGLLAGTVKREPLPPPEEP